MSEHYVTIVLRADADKAANLAQYVKPGEALWIAEESGDNWGLWTQVQAWGTLPDEDEYRSLKEVEDANS